MSTKATRFKHILESGQLIGQEPASEVLIQRLCAYFLTIHGNRCAFSPHKGLILAGPGGYQPKHKMARAIARDAFGTADVLTFDVGELRGEHAVDRLLGSQVNPLLKGELTTAIADNPKRVIVFDEIEKAPSRLLERIWHLINTGEVLGAHRQPFQLEQSVTLLTTNLGLFEEVVGPDGSVSKRPRFTYETPFEDMRAAIQQALRDTFIDQLGYPELLGCCGGAENIIVFDFLRDFPGATRKLLRNVVVRCASNHNLRLSVNDDVVEHIATSARNDPEALLLGFRGLEQHLGRILTWPLNDFFFDADPTGRAVKAQMGTDGVRFVVS